MDGWRTFLRCCLKRNRSGIKDLSINQKDFFKSLESFLNRELEGFCSCSLLPESPRYVLVLSDDMSSSETKQSSYKALTQTITTTTSKNFVGNVSNMLICTLMSL